MTDTTLNRIKIFSTWGGWITSVSGVIYTMSHTSDYIGPTITSIGLIASGVGHLVGAEISKRQGEAKIAHEHRVSSLESLIEEMNGRINDPYLQKLVDDASFEDYLMNEVD